jgi:circadian clock protein KaiB
VRTRKTVPGGQLRRADFVFRLYVAGDAANSAAAIDNLQALCRQHLPKQHKIEIVDVFLQPKRALADGVLLTPTLIKLSPEPVRKIVGTLSDMVPILHALGITPDNSL